MIALETRYEVSTQVASSRLADNEPAICTSETLAIDVSSTSMNADSPQTSAIRYGARATFGVATVPSTAISAGLLRERSDEHTSALPQLLRISYAVFCLKKKPQFT